MLSLAVSYQRVLKKTREADSHDGLLERIKMLYEADFQGDAML
jgi:hypothetical protein